MRPNEKFGVVAVVVFVATIFLYLSISPAKEGHFSISYHGVASKSPVTSLISQTVTTVHPVTNVNLSVTPFVYDTRAMSSRIMAAVHLMKNMDVNKKGSNSAISPTLFTHPLSRPLNSTMPLPPITKKFTPLTQKDVDGVEKFVFFVGYPRSGHSIVGSMMDAHPDMIIAHEFMLFERWPKQAAQLMNRAFLFNALYKDSYDDVTTGWRSSKQDKKGYTLEMKASWQGQFSRLRVIGDKSGGKVSYLYSKSPEEMQKSYKEVVDTVKIPVHTIHVIRNPYDMIATQVLYTAAYEQSPNAPAHKLAASEDNKYDNPKMLMSEAKQHFYRAEGAKNMTENCNLTVLVIYNEDFVEDPKGTMKTICDYLDLECTTEYLQLCYDKTYRSMSRTRNVVNWTPEVLKYVSNELKRYPLFHRYLSTLNELHSG